jgi:hypothetical protein
VEWGHEVGGKEVGRDEEMDDHYGGYVCICVSTSSSHLRSGGRKRFGFHSKGFSIFEQVISLSGVFLVMLFLGVPFWIILIPLLFACWR